MGILDGIKQLANMGTGREDSLHEDKVVEYIGKISELTDRLGEVIDTSAIKADPNAVTRNYNTIKEEIKELRDFYSTLGNQEKSRKHSEEAYVNSLKVYVTTSEHKFILELGHLLSKTASVGARLSGLKATAERLAMKEKLEMVEGLVADLDRQSKLGMTQEQFDSIQTKLKPTVLELRTYCSYLGSEKESEHRKIGIRKLRTERVDGVVKPNGKRIDNTLYLTVQEDEICKRVSAVVQKIGDLMRRAQDKSLSTNKDKDEKEYRILYGIDMQPLIQIVLAAGLDKKGGLVRIDAILNELAWIEKTPVIISMQEAFKKLDMNQGKAGFKTLAREFIEEYSRRVVGYNFGTMSEKITEHVTEIENKVFK